MDRVILRELQVSAAVGLLDWELRTEQVLLVDCEVDVDAAAAARTDSIENTVDYAQLRELIQQFCGERRFALLESLAHELSRSIFDQVSTVSWVRLRIMKPNIFQDAGGAGVVVERKRSP